MSSIAFCGTARDGGGARAGIPALQPSNFLFPCPPDSAMMEGNDFRN
jgi:hypothetical protein